MDSKNPGASATPQGTKSGPTEDAAGTGIFYLSMGVLVFSIQDAIVKQVSGAYALTQVVFVRSCVSVPILLGL